MGTFSSRTSNGIIYDLCYGDICPLRTSGDVCIIVNTDFAYLDCFDVIMLTGEKRGIQKIIRRRNIIRKRKPTLEDLTRYKIYEIFPNFTFFECNERKIGFYERTNVSEEKAIKRDEVERKSIINP